MARRAGTRSRTPGGEQMESNPLPGLNRAQRRFDTEAFLSDALAKLKADGRYRTFLELERNAGVFPLASCSRRRDRVVVWCSNDYLGMGQHPAVLAAMHEAIDRVGTGAGGTRNI